jgi:hypothetical protein
MERKMRRAAKVIDINLDQFALILDCTPTILPATTDDTSILDSGCTPNLFISHSTMHQQAIIAHPTQCKHA